MVIVLQCFDEKEPYDSRVSFFLQAATTGFVLLDVHFWSHSN